MLHAFTDGRDTLPDSGAGYVAEVEDGWRRRRAWRRVTGRYYAMDRDKRWDRTKLRLRRARARRGRVPAPTAGEAAVRAAYERGETDEFIKPTLVGEEGRIRDGDGVVFFNFRPDRARQLTQALARRLRSSTRASAAAPTLTEYQEDWDYPVAFPPARPAVDARLGAGRARHRASCTWPRPRSTRT